MTLSIEIPNAIAQRVADAICSRHDYTGIFNGKAETKQEFVKRYLINHIREEIKLHEIVQAQATAVEQVKADIDTKITLT